VWLRVSCCHTLTGYHLEVRLYVCLLMCVSPGHITVGQYTTGRGSSGVGLTAAVMRDPLTSEMTLGKSVQESCPSCFEN